MKKVLVTGGSGFIGSNLIDHLLEKTDWHITNLSKHTYATNPRTLAHLDGNNRYKFVAGNITDTLLVSKVIKDIDIILHLAAETHVDNSFRYPMDFLTSNVIGTFSILEALRHSEDKANKLLVAMSTDEIFGDVPSGYYCKENDPIKPRNPYSAAKAAAESYCNAYYHSFEVPIIIARSMNCWGQRQNPEKLVGKIITRCLNDRPYTLFKGNSVRGWVYVKDTCDALLNIATKGKIGEIYHIPANEYLSVPDVNSRILKIMDKAHLFEGFKGTRLKDDERYALSGDKVRYELNWMPKVSFDDGIRETAKWFEANKWFWFHVDAP